MMYNMNLKFVAADVGDKKMIVLDPEEWMQRNWVRGEFYEVHMLNYIKENYRGGTFVDVGGAMGNHSIFFSDIADDVVTFEPLRENFYHMTLNINLNKIENIDFYNFGLSDDAGIVNMWYNGDVFSNGSSTMSNPKSTTKKQRLVPVVTMDSLEINDVKLIKIDVEGYEATVLKGAVETLKRYKPDLFVECFTKKEFDEVFKILEPLGYKHPKLVFNGTPTYLFSTKDIEVPNEDTSDSK